MCLGGKDNHAQKRVRNDEDEEGPGDVFVNSVNIEKGKEIFKGIRKHQIR